MKKLYAACWLIFAFVVYLTPTHEAFAYFPRGFVSGYANLCGSQPVGQMWCVSPATGYTVFTASIKSNAGTACNNASSTTNETCIVPVDSVGGNDTTCVAQPAPSSGYTNVMLTAFSATLPCLTLQHAQSLLRNASADWMVLLRGDTWAGGFQSATGDVWTKSGLSTNQPMVVTAYGTGARPLISQSTSTDNFCWETASANGQNMAFIGIHCDKAVHDPSNPAFQGAIITADTVAGSPILNNINAGAGLPSQFFTTSAYSIYGNGVSNLTPTASVGAGTTSLTMNGNAPFTATQMRFQIQDRQGHAGFSMNGITNTVFIEDCEFDYGAGGSVGTGVAATYPTINFFFRRNIFNGSTGGGANLFIPGNCPQSYSSPCPGTVGQVTIEENASNFAAWNPNIWVYGATSLLHAWYLHDPNVAIFIHGNTVGNNASDNQYRDCGTAINNLFFANSIGLSSNLEDNPCSISYNVVEAANDNILGMRIATASPGSSGTVLSIDGVISATIGGLVVDLSNPGAIPNTASIGSVRDGVSANLAGPTTSAQVNTGGSGYGASVTGTMRWAGAGCTQSGGSVPVLNVSTNASGVITTINSITTAGNCLTMPTTAAGWTPGGGLSAGTGASFAVAVITNGIRGNGVQPGDTIEIFSGNGGGVIMNTSGSYVDNGPATCGQGLGCFAGPSTGLAMSCASPAIITEPSSASARSQDEPFEFTSGTPCSGGQIALSALVCADPANGSPTAYPVYAPTGGLCSGGADINTTGTGGTGLARTGSRKFTFALANDNLPAQPIPSFVTVGMSVFVGLSSASFPQTIGGLAGGTTVQFISADRFTLITNDASIAAIQGSNPVKDGQSTFLFNVPNNPFYPSARIGPNNLFVHGGSKNVGQAPAISFTATSSGNNASQNYIYNWDPRAVSNNTSDVGFPSANLPAVATSQILNDGITGTPDVRFPNANVEAYDAINNGSAFNGTVTGAATFNPGAGSTYDGATLAVNSGTAPSIGDMVFCTGCTQYMTVVSGSGASFTVLAPPGTMVNVGPLAMTNGSFAHFISQALLQNSQTGWQPKWTAAAANSFIRSAMQCGNQTTFLGSPSCPQQNFLLKRDIDPASNDNDPMFLEKAS